MTEGFKITWLDSGLEPRCAPNPNYPNGIDVDVSDGALKTCRVELPYPAKRIGRYRVECEKCGIKAECTTAGRPDDPTSITIGCYTQKLFPGVTRITIGPSPVKEKKP